MFCRTPMPFSPLRRFFLEQQRTQMSSVHPVAIQAFRWIPQHHTPSLLIPKRLYSTNNIRHALSTIRQRGLQTTGAPAALCYVLANSLRQYHQTVYLSAPKASDQLQSYQEIQEHSGKEEQQDQQQGDNPFAGASQGWGSLPFAPPFHSVNIIMLLFISNVIIYMFMNFFANDEWKDFMVEHFTLSHDNYHRIYPFFTHSLYQEQIFQLALDCWLLWSFGNSTLTFFGNTRMTLFWAMCCVGCGMLHITRHKAELYFGMDPLEARGRCYGPNPIILGLVGLEGLIFQKLNFIQQPPVPFVVLTAFVMVIDIWRIFTIKPEEHGAPTGGALVAYLFWRMPMRLMGLDKTVVSM